MNNPLTRLPTELEVEEELRLHIDLLLHENIQRGMSPEEARTATLKRFGNLDGVRNECVEICRRSRPLQRALKICANLLILTGLFVRIASTDRHFDHIGSTLIFIAIAGRLLLYVRSLPPSRFLPTNKPTSFSLFPQKSEIILGSGQYRSDSDMYWPGPSAIPTIKTKHKCSPSKG